MREEIAGRPHPIDQRVTTRHEIDEFILSGRCIMSHVAKRLLTVVAAGAVLMTATSAWAIADAGAKMRGDYSGNGISGSTFRGPTI
jgi:hypothetical protein